MTVNALLPVSVSVSPSANPVCAGTSVTFSATQTNGGTTPVYQWKVNSVNAGANNPVYTYTPSNGDIITCILTSNATCSTGNPATSNAVNMSVIPPVGTPGTPVPSATTICQGSSNTTYTTSASNATTYNWSITGSGNSITGTGTTGTVAWAAGFSGEATISVSANGCSGPSATASTTVMVRPTPTATISGTTTLCQNSPSPNITFANPQTLPVTITYNINGSSIATINVGANTSATLAVPTTASGTFSYNLVSVIYQSVPACSNNISGTATVTVNEVPGLTLSSSDADNIFCAGTSVIFTAGGGTDYNFRIGGVTVQDGESTTFTTSSLTNGQVVDVIVTNTFGCKTTSSGITNFVNPLPFIIITTPPACSIDIKTYSLGVTVSSGIVTSTSGIVTNTGGNTWSITGVPSGTNITLTVTDVNSCANTMVVTAPNCSCPVVLAPVSGGDKSYCETGVVPTITATVLTGETVDWYNSASNGTILRSGSLSYTPSAAGTYYAMTRNTTTTCVSSTRTPVTVTMNSLPTPTLTSSEQR